MKVTEIKDILAKHNLDVVVRLRGASFYEILCQTEDETLRVFSWLIFMRPEFEDFNASAVCLQHTLAGGQG